jgi:hypothetical protein
MVIPGAVGATATASTERRRYRRRLHEATSPAKPFSLAATKGSNADLNQRALSGKSPSFPVPPAVKRLFGEELL